MHVYIYIYNYMGFNYDGSLYCRYNEYLHEIYLKYCIINYHHQEWDLTNTAVCWFQAAHGKQESQ